ncbi:hypothetical protein EJA72_06545 [Pseudomonas sp. PB120]|nr:hypothetical protein [Pseudomonas sp. PB120]
MARELAPAGSRSDPNIPAERGRQAATAAQSSGSKLPRHRFAQRSRPARLSRRMRLVSTAVSPIPTPRPPSAAATHAH